MVVLSMKKNIFARICNEIKIFILVLQGKYKEGGFLPVETEMDYWHNQGCKYLWKKKYRKAEALFKKMTEFAPDDYLGYQRLGDVYKEQGDKKEARKYYESALQNAERSKKKHPRYMSQERIEEIKQELLAL